MAKEIKTNAMRILEKNAVSYRVYHYACDEFMDGVSVAKTLNQPPERCFKTLVTQGKSKDYFVFVIPVAEELDLKKAAAAVHEKSVEMIPVKDITPVTGYIRGGCTPVGMKKSYPTVIHSSASSFDKIILSGGRIGSQIEIAPNDLVKVVGGSFEDIIMLS